MGYRRERRRLAELAMAQAVEVWERAAPGAPADRERLREARRRARAARTRRNLLAVGVALLVGGVASLSLPTVAAVGLAFVAAVLTSWLLMTGGGAIEQLQAWFDRPKLQDARRGPPAIAEEGLPESRRALTRAVVEDASREADRLAAAHARIKEAGAAEIVRRLTDSGRRLLEGVAKRPDALATAQRALTYHLPKAAMLAETFADLEAADRDAPRRGNIRLTLARIDNLFERAELDLIAAGGDMDLELRLINQALDEDLGGDPARRSATS